VSRQIVHNFLLASLVYTEDSEEALTLASKSFGGEHFFCWALSCLSKKPAFSVTSAYSARENLSILFSVSSSSQSTLPLIKDQKC
jgi:hypothetical protein